MVRLCGNALLALQYVCSIVIDSTTNPLEEQSKSTENASVIQWEEMEGQCCSVQLNNMKQILLHQNLFCYLSLFNVQYMSSSLWSLPSSYLSSLQPNTHLHFTAGDPDVVESIADDPTYNVSSKLTLVVSRSDDNTLITCGVNHATLAQGDKRSEYTLRVLCEST